MEIDIKLYEKIENGGLGTCHLLMKKKGGCMNLKNIYLFYSEDSSDRFIVCEGVMQDNYLCYAEYFGNLADAIQSFKKAK